MLLQEKMKAICANISSAWEAGQLLLQDMTALQKHLAKMGWEVQQLDKGGCPGRAGAGLCTW